MDVFCVNIVVTNVYQSGILYRLGIQFLKLLSHFPSNDTLHYSFDKTLAALESGV